MKVLTNNQYYSQIANVIREQNGTNNTYKPQQMVRALKDLFYEEVEGVPPISFNGIGENLLDYRIDGASGGVGDRTNNLFDEIYTNIVNDWDVKYKSIFVGEGTFTLSTTCPKQDGGSATNLFFLSGNVSTGANSGTNGVYNNYPVTVTSLNGYITIGYRAQSYDPRNYQTMLNEGTTALPYEPYGYKVPVVISGKNLFNENSELNVNASVDVTSGAFPNTFGGNRRTYFFKVKPNTAYTFSCNTIGDRLYICEYNQFINPANYSISNRLFSDNIICNLGTGMSEYSFTTSSNSKMVGIYYSLNIIPTDIQIEIGNIATDYEPYHEPTTTNVYLDEPIEENESISLSDTNVNIPTIRGTNVLTVDTTVQPSNVYVKSRHESSHEAQIRQLYESVNAELTQYKAQYGELGGE